MAARHFIAAANLAFRSVVSTAQIPNLEDEHLPSPVERIENDTEVSDPRVTALGRFLRCGIDELPQLWNIVKGQMVWAGPRPDPDWMLPHYGQTCRTRLEVLPGITGFAQILNSRFMSTAEAFELDIWYIRHRTWMVDAYIILATALYMAGWHSIGRKRLRILRTLPEFQKLHSRCSKEFTHSEVILLGSLDSRTMLAPNTVLR
jgi:lipopolysaccharide/colanic/teichoic acid biosynthesis glycosyltransferase